jgi:serine protease inhibitor
MARRRAGLFFIALSLVLASCGDRVCSPGKGLPRDLSPAEQQVVQAYNAFGLKIFREIVATGTDENVFISPASVSMALGMTLNGAEGATEEAMKSTLEFAGLTMEEINSSYRGLIDLLVALDPGVVFGIANSIWYRSGEDILEPFIDDCTTYFDAEVSEMDFADPGAADVINAWVSAKTRGRIEEIVAKPIDPAFVMFLINAIYFKGTWTYQFDPDLTRNADFTGPDGTARPCRMMEQPEPGEISEFMYFSDGALEAVDLPYANGWFTMTILLPPEGTKIGDFIAGLTPEAWNAWLGGLGPHEGSIAMPRFKMEYSQRLDEVLSALGMGIAFTDAADFSGMRATGGLLISEVKHKTFVEVNEEGTEAAAVTEVGMGDTAMPDVFAMRVDRPFVFAIRERHSGTILFIGKIGDPGPGR